MGICSICKKAIDSAQPDHIPIGSAEKPICPACKAQLNLLLHSNRLIELRGAIRYLTACGETTATLTWPPPCAPSVKRTPSVCRAAADALPYEPVAQQEPPSIWINIVKAASWSLLVLIILGGLFGALAIFNTDMEGGGLLALLTLVASLFLGLFTVAGIMVYANHAEDTGEIRRLLAELVKKQR